MNYSIGQTVSVKGRFPVSISVLWKAAGHPSRVSWAVPMLRAFRAPAELRIGSGVEEVHTILGWPQVYVGCVTQFEPGLRWAMSSQPRSASAFPLPHEVRYDFEGNQRASSLTLTCGFRCGGLLALPLAPRVVRWMMKRAMARTLALLIKRVEGDLPSSVPAAPENGGRVLSQQASA